MSENPSWNGNSQDYFRTYIENRIDAIAQIQRSDMKSINDMRQVRQDEVDHRLDSMTRSIERLENERNHYMPRDLSESRWAEMDTWRLKVEKESAETRQRNVFWMILLSMAIALVMHYITSKW
jgi:uncharacterized protein (DUF885 family)